MYDFKIDTADKAILYRDLASALRGRLHDAATQEVADNVESALAAGRICVIQRSALPLHSKRVAWHEPSNARFRERLKLNSGHILQVFRLHHWMHLKPLQSNLLSLPRCGTIRGCIGDGCAVHTAINSKSM